MPDCKTIIKQILLEATENGQTISEDELIKRLDKIPGFWEQAMKEDFGDMDLIQELSLSD